MTEKQYPELPEPDSYIFQHEETGLTQFVDAQQVEWGFEKNNPRWKKVGEAYTKSQVIEAIDADRAMRAAQSDTAPVAGPSDSELEEVMLKCGARWVEDSFWRIEDADFHPALRSVLAKWGAAPTTQTPLEDLAKRLIGDVMTSDAIAKAACQRVAEIPDRNSPEGWPEAMLVTHEELHQIVREAVIEAQPQHAVSNGEIHQFRKANCANWYDGHPDHEDGDGPYETRVLYTQPQETALSQYPEIPDPFQFVANHIMKVNPGMTISMLADSLSIAYGHAKQLHEVAVDARAQQEAALSRDAEDAARLNWLIEQRAYVVSDPETCEGYWLHWAYPDGSTWVQVGGHDTPRAAIDAARAQAKENGL